LMLKPPTTVIVWKLTFEIHIREVGGG